MTRRWSLALALFVLTFGILPPAIYASDPELFVTVAAAAIVALPFLDALAAAWYSILWARSGGVVVGLSALFAWVTSVGLALIGIPAFRRIADLPPLESSAFLVGWGVVIIGIGPFLTAAWLIAQRMGDRFLDESPAAIAERATVAAAEVVDVADRAAATLIETAVELRDSETTRIADAGERTATATERIADATDEGVDSPA